jgi:hypothetical protein
VIRPRPNQAGRVGDATMISDGGLLVARRRDGDGRRRRGCGDRAASGARRRSALHGFLFGEAPARYVLAAGSGNRPEGGRRHLP